MKSEVLAHSIGGAAKAINCGKTKLYELMAEGRIKAKKLGTKTLIPHSELVSLLDSLPDAEFGKPPGPIMGRSSGQTASGSPDGTMVASPNHQDRSPKHREDNND
jgi:excisionase family DNA binding protein